MTARPRATLLTTVELHNLDAACQVISRAFGGQCPYLVGTAGAGAADGYRDVDVRLMRVRAARWASGFARRHGARACGAGGHVLLR